MKFSTILKKAGFRKMGKNEVAGNCYEKGEIFVDVVDYGSWEAAYAYLGKKKFSFEEDSELEAFLKEKCA